MNIYEGKGLSDKVFICIHIQYWWPLRLQYHTLSIIIHSGWSLA